MDPHTEPPNSDADLASPLSSNYSSCDGSDFDRYCSANSALGTASLCSSVGNHSELLDSIKCSSRWNGFDGVLDFDQDSILTAGMISLSNMKEGSKFVRDLKGKREAESSIIRDNKFHNSTLIHDTNCVGETSRSELFVGNCEDLMYYKDKSAIGINDSEGEGSNNDSDSSEESRIQFVQRKELLNVKKLLDKTDNPLLMNSLAAFGADDWDEFEKERGDNLEPISLFDDRQLEKQSSANHVDMNVEKEIDVKKGLNACEVKDECSSVASEVPCIRGESMSSFHVGEASNRDMVEGDESVLIMTPLCNSIFEQSFNALNEAFDMKKGVDEEVEHLALESIGDGSSNYIQENGNNIEPNESSKLEVFESYNEMVLEMEEILLDSMDSNGTQSTPPDSHHYRDGSSAASTSGADEPYPLPQSPPNINRVEVIGAKQKKGNVSFGEKLVGVKEYTIYKLRVYSEKSHWEVERRYRDFVALYNQLYIFFSSNGLSLPSAWSKVDRESRKLFGNVSPDVITHRSVLIEDCLMSILNSTYPFGTPGPLVTFLSPGQVISNSGYLKSLIPQSLSKHVKDQTAKNIPNFGKTISLVVEIKARKSLRQLLEAQHYKCAGCHKDLDAGNTLLREIVQTFGWNKPRFCAYTSQLFCGVCHTNDTVILPATVLHLWDFSLYPVSQLAKLFLDSIYEQPMLCVSAVNPFLFSKVPALLHIMSIRKKIGAMFPYVRCPFRKAIQRNLGIRRYLLENNDFFSLRDLVDLSKGPFSALPTMVENVSCKILEHITEQCLTCYDSGIQCAARQDCDDPASLIFPFQEAEAARCSSCRSIFHRPCFVKLMGCCPCGKTTTNNKQKSFQVDS